MCVCVCVCACVRACVRARACVCVCVCVIEIYLAGNVIKVQMQSTPLKAYRTSDLALPDKQL